MVRALRRDHPQVWVSVSATTRFPRPGEIDGVHYRFLSRERFAGLVAAGEMLEHAEFAGNLYGTPRRPVLERLASGAPVVLEIDLQGARLVRQRMPEALLVFLKPPSWEELVRRLTARGTEDPALVERRLAMAREELAAEDEFDVSLVNSDVETVCTRLLTLVSSPPPPPEAPACPPRASPIPPSTT